MLLERVTKNIKRGAVNAAMGSTYHFKRENLINKRKRMGNRI